MEPQTKEDAVKRMLKRTKKLNSPGVVGDLFRMSEHCHKEVYENGNMEHLPMDYVRYEGTEEEVAGELFYICKQCLSKYILEHPKVVTENKIIILRGELSKECKDMLREKTIEAYKKAVEEQRKEQEKIDKIMKSDKACPVCGKPFKDHKEEDFRKCFKEYAQINPPDKDGGFNQPQS